MHLAAVIAAQRQNNKRGIPFPQRFMVEVSDCKLLHLRAPCLRETPEGFKGGTSKEPKHPKKKNITIQWWRGSICQRFVYSSLPAPSEQMLLYSVEFIGFLNRIKRETNSRRLIKSNASLTLCNYTGPNCIHISEIS